MPEPRNATYQKVFQRHALPLGVPSSVFNEELDTSAALAGESGQAVAANPNSTAVSSPANTQRQLEAGNLYNAHVQRRLPRAGSLHGNKVVRLIVQHNCERKTRTLSWQVELAQP
jgi:hypothetical protein